MDYIEDNVIELEPIDKSQIELDVGSSEVFTVDGLRDIAPKSLRRSIRQEVVDELNQIADGIDTGFFQEQLLGYSTLLGPGVGWAKLGNAIKFVSMVNIHDHTQEQAYKIVFPVKAKEIEDRGGKLSSFASEYANTKTVLEIQKKAIMTAKFTMVPQYYRSINKMLELMDGVGASPDDKVSPTVQLNGAIAVEAALRPDAESTINVNMGVTDGVQTMQQNINDTLSGLVGLMRTKLDNGADIKELPTIDVTLGEVNSEVSNG